MKPIHIVVTATLIIALAISAASFTMPSLLGRPIVPGMAQQTAPQLPSQTLTPEDVKVQSQEETFGLTLSGNIYMDKLPVEGAEVTVYLNGRRVGRTTAGDLYQFQVPGVRLGDVIRVDASYQGHTGTASEVVKFKSMYLDVQIKSGRSFIRNALEMLPKKSDIEKAQQQPQTATPASTSQAAPQSTQSASSPQTTTSTTDANQLTSQVVGDTTKTLTDTIGKSNGALAWQPPVTTADTGSTMKISDINDAMKAEGF